MSIGSSPFQGGGSASIADATESTAGKIRIATTSESNTGTNDVTAMTPAKVKARIDAALVGGVEYKGSYTGQSLVTADKGDLYVSAATYSLAGVQVLSGDHIIFNQDAADPVTSAMFDKIDNTDQVSSVNTLTGAVVLSGANLDGDHSPSNYSATTDKIEKHLEGIDNKFGTLGTAATSASSDFLAVSNNLSDLNNAVTARTNLGLGTVATLDTGVSNGNVIVADATGLPAIDGSQLTGVTGTDSTKLAIANNLSDLNSASTARTNLGLGTAATSASSDFLAVSNNLSDLNNAVTARTNLGLGTAATSASSDFLAVSNNLSDLNNAVTARTNLGLGTVATLDTGVANGNVIVADSTGLPAIDGSQLTGVTATDSTKLAIANNLSDLNNAVTARTNLGLGTVATLDTGVANGNVIVADATGLPAIDGSQLTGVTATDSTKLAIANNLSDLNNAVTARTNLGLGTVATLDTGVANGNVIVADATGLPAIDGSQLTGITATDSTKLAIANNLSDLNNAVTARTNLGLGTAATSASSDFLAVSNNLSDLNNAVTARTNLGLGTVATLDTGVANGNVIVADATGLPAIDGSQLTGVLKNVVEDTTPQLGGDLDVNGQDIATTSGNANLGLKPHGTGFTELIGNTTGGNNPGALRFNCEQNTHGVIIKSPLHSDYASGGDYTLTLPTGLPASDKVLQSSSAGVLSWVAQSGGGGGSVPEVKSASPSGAYTISTHEGIEEVYLLTPSADIVVNLPSASTATTGFKYNIKNLSGSYNLTITPASSTIDGSSTYVTSSQYESVTLVSDGSNYYII